MSDATFVVTAHQEVPLYPDPIIQDDAHTGCLEASIAFVCRWFGVEADQEDIALYRQVHGIHVRLYPEQHGIAATQHTTESDGHARRWWLGPGADILPWLVAELRGGAVALLDIERERGYRHSVVLVEARPEGGLVMDPLSGYEVDDWAFLLGRGPGRQPFWGVTHRVCAWYRPSELSAREAQRLGIRL